MKTVALFLLAVSCGAPAALAQILGAHALPNPVTLPAARRSGPAALNSTPQVRSEFTSTPASLSRRVTVWDELPVTKMTINFAPEAVLEINQKRLTNWRFAYRAPFGIALESDLSAQVSGGIAHAKGGFVRDLLDGRAWDRTPTSLRRTEGDIVRVLVDDDSDANPSMRRLLSWRTRVYECEIIPASTGAPTQRRIVVAIGEGDDGYVFVFEGSTDRVRDLRSTFERLVSGVERPTASSPSAQTARAANGTPAPGG